jgi:hypothetical protein
MSLMGRLRYDRLGGFEAARGQKASFMSVRFRARHQCRQRRETVNVRLATLAGWHLHIGLTEQFSHLGAPDRELNRDY